jgi:hypothetical protein
MHMLEPRLIMRVYTFVGPTRTVCCYARILFCVTRLLSTNFKSHRYNATPNGNRAARFDSETYGANSYRSTTFQDLGPSAVPVMGHYR